MRGGAAAPVLLATGALLSACGEERMLDDRQLEAALKQQLDRSAGVTSRSVTCPEGVVIEQGRRFDCTLVAPNGDRVRVAVILTDDEGGFDASVPREQFR